MKENPFVEVLKMVHELSFSIQNYVTSDGKDDDHLVGLEGYAEFLEVLQQVVESEEDSVSLNLHIPREAIEQYLKNLEDK